jgi:C-terminal processing protease CtpA/Prc
MFGLVLKKTMERKVNEVVRIKNVYHKKLTIAESQIKDLKKQCKALEEISKDYAVKNNKITRDLEDLYEAHEDLKKEYSNLYNRHTEYMSKSEKENKKLTSIMHRIKGILNDSDLKS